MLVKVALRCYGVEKGKGKKMEEKEISPKIKGIENYSLSYHTLFILG